jgi:hypothetical protein
MQLGMIAAKIKFQSYFRKTMVLTMVMKRTSNADKKHNPPQGDSTPLPPFLLEKNLF